MESFRETSKYLSRSFSVVSAGFYFLISTGIFFFGFSAGIPSEI